MAFDQFEKERIVQVLGRLQLRMDFVETSMNDMLHKIKLMMIKDAQTLGFDNPFSDSVIGAPLIQDALMRDDNEDDDQWVYDEDSLKFNT